MHRILALIAVVAVLGSAFGAALKAAPAFADAGRHVAPSPAVSVTTLPQLPTVAPEEPTYAPGTAPTTPGISVAPGTVIQVVGDVSSARVLTLKDLQLMRRSSVTLRVLDADGKRRVHIYSGVLLRDVIAAVGPTGPGGAETSTKAWALVQGVNGDSALVAFPEFETAFNNKGILVAYMVDGAPLSGSNIAELIVPEDQTQGRFITGISTIRIGSPPP